MIRIGIVGGSGITGRELIAVLLRHKAAEIRYITSRGSKGVRVDSVFPEFAGICGLSFSEPSDEVLFDGIDGVFVCLPHTEAMEYVRKFEDKGIRVIDLSADYRIKDLKIYEKVYGHKHAYPETVKRAVYGLPEFYREDIKNAGVVANTGCYAVCAALALAPAVERLAVDSIICDAKSGISGAGIKPTPINHYMNISENVIPYNYGRVHRHVPEIEAVLKAKTGKKAGIILTPQLTALDRGMLSVNYMKLKKWVDIEKVKGLYADYYKGEFFVRFKDRVDVRGVQRTNFIDMAISGVKEHKTLIVISAVDNLGKGASWQAVQNMNIMFGVDETEGLL